MDVHQKAGWVWTRALVLIGFAIIAQSCAPSIVPLYRDYETNRSGDSLLADIRDALSEVGWTLAPGRFGDEVVSTEEQPLQNFGVYKTSARIDVVQVNGGYVRVYVHPFRKYLISGRKSKILFLDRRMRAQVVRPINEALASRGIELRGSALEREEKSK